MMATPKQHLTPPALADWAQPRYRSGAVARRAGMPVATLRIWEQRYRAVSPVSTASGHRLYTDQDVQRVTLLRQLTQRGQAIGLLAALDTERLREMLSADAEAHMGAPVLPASSPAALRLVMVGPSFARRLQQWSRRQPGGVLVQQVGVFESLAQAMQAAPAVPEGQGAQEAQEAQGPARPGIDALVWQVSSLHPGASQQLQAAQRAWCARKSAVVYRYSNAAGRAELADAGAALFQEPADDQALGLWLASLGYPKSPPSQGVVANAETSQIAAALARQAVSPPRFAELALTEFAGLSSTIACECPSHLAQLLMQISNFESYSGDCAHRSPADAQLHAYLQRTAGVARMLFEAALEHVAVAEGLPLPASSASRDS